MHVSIQVVGYAGDNMNEVKRSERGWAGHSICSERCLFRRNTLLEFEHVKIVVSTVGLIKDIRSRQNEGDAMKFDTFGIDRYFETRAFHSDSNDTRYNDPDISSPVDFESQWSINEIDADDKANVMHNTVVEEISERMQKGEFFTNATVHNIFGKKVNE